MYCAVRLFDVMEARHTEGKYFTEAELIAIMADVCEGVAILHQHRPPIAHRDIKGNCLLKQCSSTHSWL
jgi:serine/threonine protein kinase